MESDVKEAVTPDADKKGGFASASDRPYAPAHPGQLEERKEDGAVNSLLSASKGIEDTHIRIYGERNAQHGNVGFAGNYPVDPIVEK